MYVWRKIEMRSCNHRCYGKSISISYSACVFIALGIQRAIWILRIVIFGVSRCTMFFHILSQKARFFKKVSEHKMCAVIFSTLTFETYLILRRTEQEMIKKCTFVIV